MTALQDLRPHGPAANAERERAAQCAAQERNRLRLAAVRVAGYAAGAALREGVRALNPAVRVAGRVARTD